MKATEFLKLFHGDGPYHVARIPHPKGVPVASCIGPSEVEQWVEENNDGHGLYFYPATLALSFDKPDKASADDVVSSHCVWLDIDPGPNADHTDCLKALTKGGLPDPTLVLFSGRGVWGIWFLDRAITPAECQAINRWMRDKARKNAPKNVNVDDCHSPEHLARLCGTVNQKSGMTADVLSHFPGNVYAPSAFGQTADTKAEERELKIERVDPDLDALSEELREIATAKYDEKKWASRSHMLNRFICQCLREAVPDAMIYAFITNKDYPISDHVRFADQNNKKLRHNIPQYAKKQIKSGYRLNDAEDMHVTPFSEMHFAAHFVRHHPEYRYCKKWKTWLHWDGQVWQRDETNRARADIGRIVDEFATMRSNVKIATAKTVGAVERLAADNQTIAVTPEDLDTDTTIINTPAGIVCLRTGDIRPHDPDVYCTRITTVAPEEGDPVEFNKLLDFITGDDTVFREYLLRLFGYALTGSTQEQSLFFFHGGGNNCKSVLVKLAADIMGDYARVMAFDTLTNMKAHPTDLADLRGARLAHASETEAGVYLNESQIKRMTGGDVIKARFMHTDFFEYEPQYTLIIVGNHKPRIRNVDPAIARRLKLTPFTRTLADGEVDKTYLERVLLPEAGMVFRVLIEAAVRWAEGGLEIPAQVRAATTEYLNAEDTVTSWVEERCVASAELSEPFKLLRQSYEHWCRENGERPLGRNTFRDAMTKNGFENRPGKGNLATRDGIALTDIERRRIKGEEAAKKAQGEVALDLVREKARELEAELDAMKENAGEKPPF